MGIHRDIWRRVVLRVPNDGIEVMRPDKTTTRFYSAGQQVFARILVYRSGRMRRKDCLFKLEDNWPLMISPASAIAQGVTWKDANAKWWNDEICEFASQVEPAGKETEDVSQ